MLSKTILRKAIRCNNELGWKLKDVLEVASDAYKNNMAILGGQVQYRFPDGTCELYWMNSDTQDRREDENWDEYIKRTYDEFVTQFQKNILPVDIDQDAIKSFSFLEKKAKSGIDINSHQIFIMYFLSKNERIN